MHPSGAAASPKRAREARVFHPATDHDASRQLTAGIVNEMSSLLGGIGGLSEIYPQVADRGAQLTQGFALIHKSSLRLQILLGYLKTLNQRPGEAIEPNSFCLCRSVRGMFEMFSPLLAKSVEVETVIPPGELAVHLDEILLRRVLLNLTLNLRDELRACGMPAATLRVSIRRQLDARAALTLSAGGPGAALDAPAPGPDARARVADARERLGELGGTLAMASARQFVLVLPLVI